MPTCTAAVVCLLLKSFKRIGFHYLILHSAKLLNIDLGICYDTYVIWRRNVPAIGQILDLLQRLDALEIHRLLVR